MDDPRDVLLKRLSEDLVGPQTAGEVIPDRPTDRYLTGILFPARTAYGAEEDDENPDADDDEDGTSRDRVKTWSGFRPSSAGLSFAVEMQKDRRAALEVVIEAGRYLAEYPENEAGKEEAEGSESAERRRPRILPKWRHSPLRARIDLGFGKSGVQETDLSTHGIPDMSLHARVSSWKQSFLITLAISNTAKQTGKRNRSALEEATLLQTSMKVRCKEETCFVPKPETRRSGTAERDLLSGDLLYRNSRQYAVGHTCSAAWKTANGTVAEVATSWIPETLVRGVDPSGDPVFSNLVGARENGPLGAAWLARADLATTLSGLEEFIGCYDAWIKKRADELDAVPQELRDQGGLHLEECFRAADRMRRGLAALSESDEIFDAFRLANLAIAIQHDWKQTGERRPIIWRPFQLGFVLLCLSSVANPGDDDREVMDLLWFPTGGGKTEAYLLLTAFTIFLRRIRAAGDAKGAGVTCFMRYTLRLLTIQQFERASALICVCELVRLGAIDANPVKIPTHFATDSPISTGLWVGDKVTPNKLSQAEGAINGDNQNSPVQLRDCPCCHRPLNWKLAADESRVEVRCHNSECRLGTACETLPVWTVDDDIYRECPSLIIGTVDKYAQIVRDGRTGRLFGIATPYGAPDLIVQDELHLISGPLGSLAGLYEVAVDELCLAGDGARAKVIGSTATIRRATEQIMGLFARPGFQFPPPGLDHSNSGFAVEDASSPGRRYVGFTTAGRSAKFVLQAVAASLLQGATSPAISDDKRDGYWTLVNYFNSLRELGGALVLMRDAVVRTIEEFAARREEKPREAGSQIELTSRISSTDIPVFLKQLERQHDHDDHADIVLASNMISVGMDVSRLGLMVVNGQPKTIAEYIQTTSRVGRSSSAPGLVLTVYNVSRARDRSRYESFAGWHQSLYREVEATSVTPFAPRARDRALHAPFVAMVRHLVPGMSTPANVEDHEKEILHLLDRIVERIKKVDEGEAENARKELEKFLDDWIDGPPREKYWEDHMDALLMSAEHAAETGQRGRDKRQKPTPNSLRNVEASTKFMLLGNAAESDEERSANRARRRERWKK